MTVLLARRPEQHLARPPTTSTCSKYCYAGLNFGSYADRSPIIAYDGEAQPAYTMASFTQSTVPGCRTPHLWLDDGRSLYDAMGPDYTLLRFDPAINAGPLLAAAGKRGVPMVLVDVSAKDAAAFYRHKLVLSRPDQHVAWRGDHVPANALALVDLIRGTRARLPTVTPAPTADDGSRRETLG